eukprot:jgi/Tetstr1/422015/TSEL_012879.t1
MLRQLVQRAVRPATGLLLPVAAAGLATGAPRALGSSPAPAAPLHIEEETHCRQRSLLALEDKVPQLWPQVFVAPNAVVVGDVDIQDASSVWYGAVVRGDLSNVTIGMYSSIGERSSVTTASASPTGGDPSTVIGDCVIVGAGCALRSCKVGSNSLIEDKAVVMEGATVGANAILGAGSVLPPGRAVPDGQMWAGNPAKYVRDVSAEELEEIAAAVEAKKGMAAEHAYEFLPVGNIHLDASK